MRMSAKIVIPPFLQHLTNKTTEVHVEGRTVKECLIDFAKKFPGTGPLLLDKEGKLFAYVQAFVNGHDTGSMDGNTPVRDGDEIHLLLVITGG
jgi:sulfur-carrier protein